MEIRKKRFAIPWIGMVLVCVIAIAVSAASIFTTYRMQEMASMIYEHPYTVSNESRAMRSRLLDMRFFILNMFTQTDRDEINIQQIVEERYGMQYDAIKVIGSQYLGPQEDVVRLKEAMGELERTQDESFTVILSMDEASTLKYIEDNLYPKYDAVSDALDIIIRFADEKVKSLEVQAREMSVKATVSSLILTLFLPSYFLIAFWRERKNIREIRYREQLFDILSTNVDEVFAIFDLKQDSLEYVSANCQRVLEIKADELTNDLEALRRRIPDEEKEKFDEFMQKKKFGGEKDIDLPMQFSSGELRWIRFQIFPGVAHGKVNRYILSITDQSEDMRIRQTLRDALVNAQNANAAKQDFLSRMSHEIRTPMNAIVGMTAIAATYIEDRKRVENCLEKIGYSSKHLMTLINDILDMSKIDEGKMTIAQENFNLENVVESITSIIYPQTVERKQNFNMKLLDVTDTQLVGDALRLNQILLNLLSNSLKFTPAGGSIGLDIRQIQKKNDRVRLRFTVRDTGIGMSREFMERLFLPFEQEHGSGSLSNTGTGLGMSITKNLITLMGGTIAVESSPGSGSTFTVELDFGTPEGTENAGRCNQDIENLKVLIADDDRDSCVHTSLTLENMGITSCWVLSGTECVEKVIDAHKTGEDYDVCLIDWKMPDMDGIEVTRRVRGYVGPDTTIIIITAYDFSAIEQSAREAGADAFLAKPIFSSTLYNTLISVTGAERTVHMSEQESDMLDVKGCHVLLVEDNELNREIAVEMLKILGINAVCACNGKEAVSLFLSDKDDFDLILMDVQMPVMDGYQATDNIRRSGHARAKDIPIIAMTANAFHEDVVKAYEVGMNGHLAKPVDLKQLYRTIRSQVKLKD